MASIEVREVVTAFHETDSASGSTREDRTYEVGAVIDGVFVRFATIDQGHLDHAKQRQEAAEARGEQSPPSPEPASAQAQRQEGAQAPNESARLSDLSPPDHGEQ